MAEPTVEKPNVVENLAPAKQSDFQIGSIGHRAAGGAGAGAPPLDGAAVARIKSNPQQAPRADLLALQRTVGNRAVAALVRGEAQEVAIQAKLEVGPVSDGYEKEADCIARVVTSNLTQHKPVVNPKRRDEEGAAGAAQNSGSNSGPAANIKRMVKRKSAQSSVRADGSFTADTGVHQRVRQMENGGRPLPDSVRNQMEPSFGADFSGVRIHTGGDAVQLSRDIGARAFTHGSHIAFGAGKYNPNSQEGRHLLAHELTHTIQQIGLQPFSPLQRSSQLPIRRGPKGMVQRAGTWEKFKAFVSRSETLELVKPDKVAGNAKDIQAAALTRATKARDDGRGLVLQAKGMYDQQRQQHTNTTPAQENTGKDITESKGNVFGRARVATSGVKAGDKAHAEFLTKAVTDVEKIPAKLDSNVNAITMVNDAINAPIKSVSGQNESEGRKPKAWQSAGYAKESEQLVESIREQIRTMGTQANVAEGKKRSGLDAKSLPAAEKSASDSAMTLMGMKAKISGYLDYLQTDLKVLEGHLANHHGSVAERFGEGAAQRALGSGVERSVLGGGDTLTDEQAFAMGGEAQGMKGAGDKAQETDEAKQAAFEVGKLAGKRTTLKSSNKSANPKPPKKLAKPEAKFAEKLKRLELTSLLYARACKRIPEAEQHVASVGTLQDEATGFYNDIDTARKTKKNPNQGDIDDAVIKAGMAVQKVSLAQVHLEKMYRFKKEVYDESQKHEDLVGKRAMGSGTRKLKKAAGIVAGGAVRVMTGGLYSLSAEDEAGGYRVGLKSRTIVDDIIRKNFEIEQILKGVGGAPVKGLGGPNGARAYAIFKGIAFALQIVRDIASACALWVTLLTAGVGAPVGVVFASISIFATIAKGVIDLLLLGWSSAGLMNTNDPRSRSILRGENTRQGLAFGEAAFVGASAGMIMGLSGNAGLMQGTRQDTAFSTSSLEGNVKNVAIGPVTPLVGNIAQNVGVNNLSNFSPETGYETAKANKKVEQARKAKRALAVLSHPVQSAFSALAGLLSSKKKKRESKFATVLPNLVKNIEKMNSTVQAMPATEGGGPGGGPVPSSEPAPQLPPQVPSGPPSVPPTPPPTPPMPSSPAPQSSA